MADLLLRPAAGAIMGGRMRTPVDIALYLHYLGKVRSAVDAEVVVRNERRPSKIDLRAAIALGLEQA